MPPISQLRDFAKVGPVLAHLLLPGAPQLSPSGWQVCVKSEVVHRLAPSGMFQHPTQPHSRGRPRHPALSLLGSHDTLSFFRATPNTTQAPTGASGERIFWFSPWGGGGGAGAGGPRVPAGGGAGAARAFRTSAMGGDRPALPAQLASPRRVPTKPGDQEPSSSHTPTTNNPLRSSPSGERRWSLTSAHGGSSCGAEGVGARMVVVGGLSSREA